MQPSPSVTIVLPAYNEDVAPTSCSATFGEAFARTLQIPLTLLALAVTVAAAWSRRDAVKSLAGAAAASLVTLPVTWFYHPAAMIPFALVALLRARHTREAGRVAALVTAATVISIIAISALPLVWLAEAGRTLASTTQ
jgi:hypothetical protein